MDDTGNVVMQIAYWELLARYVIDVAEVKRIVEAQNGR